MLLLLIVPGRLIVVEFGHLRRAQDTGLDSDLIQRADKAGIAGDGITDADRGVVVAGIGDR